MRKEIKTTVATGTSVLAVLFTIACGGQPTQTDQATPAPTQQSEQAAPAAPAEGATPYEGAATAEGATPAADAATPAEAAPAAEGQTAPADGGPPNQ